MAVVALVETERERPLASADTHTHTHAQTPNPGYIAHGIVHLTQSITPASGEQLMGLWEKKLDIHGSWIHKDFATWAHVSKAMQSFQKMDLPSEQRQKKLAQELCGQATKVFTFYRSRRKEMIQHFHKVWVKYMDQLIETEKHRCNEFNSYAKLEFNPRFWGWAESLSVAKRMMNTLRIDPHWLQYQDLVRWTPYGTPKKVEVDGGASGQIVASEKNIISSWYISTLQAATSLSLQSFSAILDFGGGSTMQSQTTCRFGYNGAYIIYDLIPVSLAQHYFLRLAGFAAVRVPCLGELTADQPPPTMPVPPTEAPTTAPPGIITLVSDVGLIKQLLPLGGLKLFFATFSFSETPRALRDAVEPALHAFHVFYIWFADIPGLSWDGNATCGEAGDATCDKVGRWGPNLQYFRQLLEHLGDISFCMWRGHEYLSPNSYGLVAMRPNLGNVRCIHSMGCSPSTVVKCKGKYAIVN